jgi:hypothetical protein
MGEKCRKGIMDAEGFKERTKAFAVRVVRLVEALPKSRTSDIIGRQLLRSGTSRDCGLRISDCGLFLEGDEQFHLIP